MSQPEAEDGAVAVSLRFRRPGPHEEIRRVLVECELGRCRILVLPNEPKLDGSTIGEATPRSLAHHRHSGAFTPFRDDDWDFGIALSPLATGLSTDFPAYFAAIVAHEAAHLRIASTDLDAHVYSLFYLSHRSALSNAPYPAYFDLPTEYACNEFGVLIASRMFSREQLQRECAEVAHREPARLGEFSSALLPLTGKNVLGSVRTRVRDLYLPFSSRAVEVWDEELTKSRALGRRSLTQSAAHLSQLF